MLGISWGAMGASPESFCVTGFLNFSKPHKQTQGLELARLLLG